MDIENATEDELLGELTEKEYSLMRDFLTDSSAIYDAWCEFLRDRLRAQQRDAG